MDARHNFPPTLSLPDQPVMGRGTRKPDMPYLFAVLAARQQALPTAQAMRAGSMADMGGSAADRLVRLLSSGDGVSRNNGTGAFNKGTAQFLTGTEQGEEGVYRGA